MDFQAVPSEYELTTSRKINRNSTLDYVEASRWFDRPDDLMSIAVFYALRC